MKKSSTSSESANFRNPAWNIKSNVELKKWSNKEEFRFLYFDPTAYNSKSDNLKMKKELGLLKNENIGKYLNEIWNDYHIKNIGFAKHQKGYYHSRINESFFDLIIVRKGVFLAKFDKKTVKIPEGNIILIPPHKMCDTFAEKNGIEVYWLHLKNSPYWKSIFPKEIFVSNQNKFEEELSLLDAYKLETKNIPPENIILKPIAEAFIFSLRKKIILSFPREKKQYEKIESLIDKIIKNPSYAWILSEETKKLKLSAQKLNSIFIEKTSLSFSKFIAERRMNLALKLLKTKKLNNTQIAKKVGFSNAQSFAKAFRLHYGNAPKRSIKNFQKCP